MNPITIHIRYSPTFTETYDDVVKFEDEGEDLYIYRSNWKMVKIAKGQYMNYEIPYSQEDLSRG